MLIINPALEDLRRKAQSVTLYNTLPTEPLDTNREPDETNVYSHHPNVAEVSKHWRNGTVEHVEYSTIDTTPRACACPAPHPPSARFCPRCGGTIRRPSAAMAWIRGAAVRMVQMVVGVFMLPIMLVPLVFTFGAIPFGCEPDAGPQLAYKWLARMLVPRTPCRVLKRILSQ